AKHPWGSVIPGTVLSCVLIFLISQLFPLYVALFPPNHAYSVFGVFLVLTFWLYLLGIVLVLGAELNAFVEQPARSAALAEATAAAQRGRAHYNQQSRTVDAEARGDAPALRGGGVLGTPVRSAGEQLAADQGGAEQTGAADRNTEEAAPPPPRAGLAGRLVGLVGLVLAALLLRGSMNGRERVNAQ